MLKDVVRLLFLAILGAAVPAFAQSTYPAKPVKIVVPVTTGGPSDLVAVTNGIASSNSAVVVSGTPAVATISPSHGFLTLINVFTVEPANQRQLLELLALATETSVRHARGFISASLHRSLDGTKVTMYDCAGKASAILQAATGRTT